MKITGFNFIIGLGLLWLVAVPATPQDSKPKAEKPVATAWTPARTPDGQPDVQGFWLTNEYGMGCLSDPTNGNVGCVQESGEPRRANGRGGGRVRQKSASRIIDAPDGEIPYQPWARERQKFLLSNYFEPTKPEFIDPQQRCWPLGAVRQFTWHDV
jgi:hypothetical protein